MIKRVFKKTLYKVGIDIRKVPSFEKHKYVWLAKLGINSVIDIGANIGQFVTEMKNYLPDAIFYCFEPLLSEYNLLQKNTRRMCGVQTFNMALSDFNGKSMIYHYDFSPASSLLSTSKLSLSSFPFIGTPHREDIIVNKLDDIVQSLSIDLKPQILIKIDVQGLEDKVIIGGINTIKNAKALIIEVEFQELYKEAPLFKDIYNLLNSMDFEFGGIISTSLSAKDGLPLFGDALFFNKDNI